MHITLQATKNDLLVASLTALAIAIHIVESSIPSIIPGIKPGLSNIIILICLFTFDFKTAAQVSLLRVFVASLLMGSFLSPTFILSLSGAISSLFSVSILWLLFIKNKVEKNNRLSNVSNHYHFINNGFIGPIGVALVSSVSHMLGQFYIAWFLYIPHPQLFKMLPIFITISVILGIASGLLAIAFLKSQIFNQFRQQIHTK